MRIVFDIGGTKMRIAKSVSGNSLTESVVLPTPPAYSKGLEQLVREIKALAGSDAIQSIAGGVPAVLNEDKTVIVNAANLSDWSGKTFAADLVSEFKCPVKLENDAALGALGEASAGAGKDFKTVTYIAIGTGIGGAWVIDKKLSNSEHSFEPGHHIIDPEGLVCPGDGKKGHWEAYINEPDFLTYLVTGLHNTLLYWPADVVVLGGGVTLHSNWNIKEIQSKLEELLSGSDTNPEIKIAELGDDAGLYGSLLL